MACPPIQHPAPLNLSSIKWLAAVDSEGNKVIALDPGDYESLGKNMAKIVEYITNQNTVTKYYVGCIENHNAERNNDKTASEPTASDG